MRSIPPQRLVVPILITLTLAMPAPAFAQRGRGVAAPRPAPPVHVNAGVRYGWGWGMGLGFGFAWYPFYNPWYPGWYPYRAAWWYPPYAYGWYGPYPYGYMLDELTAALRLEVKPREAEVYVDGYRAGSVDDFDGTFQRLRVRPGEHELVLYHDGLRTVRQQLYLAQGSDQKVKLVMEPLGPGEAQEPRPTPRETPEEAQPQPRQRRAPPPERRAPPPDTPEPRAFGALTLNVQPADAEILIDGAAWTIPAGESRLVIQLPEGRHRVEVRKAGFATYAEEIAVQRGRTLSLNVSLIRSGGGAW